MNFLHIYLYDGGHGGGVKEHRQILGEGVGSGVAGSRSTTSMYQRETCS